MRLTTFELAGKNIRRKPRRSFCLVLVILLFAFSLYAGSDVLVGGVDAPEGLRDHVVGRVDQFLHRGAPASLRTVLPLMLARNHSWFKQRT